MARGSDRRAASAVGYLGLGSNLGERRGLLQAAVDGLQGHGIDVLACSSVYETEPVGEIVDQPAFLNAALRIQTAQEPEVLLAAAKEVEVELGRSPDAARHGPRPVDVDLLLLGDRVRDEPALALPHRDLLTRRFVLVPLLELDFELATPDGRRLSDALARLAVAEQVVRWAGPALRT